MYTCICNVQTLNKTFDNIFNIKSFTLCVCSLSFYQYFMFLCFSLVTTRVSFIQKATDPRFTIVIIYGIQVSGQFYNFKDCQDC